MASMNNKICFGFCPVSLGIAFGIVSGLCMLALAWAGWLWGYGTIMIDQIASIYHGYAATMIGGLWGLLWGFVKGFIGGLIFGWVYNGLVHCRSKCCPANKCDTK